MQMVYHRKKVHRTTFRNLGFGEHFYNIQPNDMFYYEWAKVGRRWYATGPESVGGHMMATEMADVGTKVAKRYPVWDPYRPGTAWRGNGI